MNKLFIVINPILVISMSFLFLSKTVLSAGFDCTKTQTDIESMICSDAELSESDAKMNTLYKEVISKIVKRDTLKKNQRNWIKRRDLCKDTPCLKKAYQYRINKLEILYDSEDKSKYKMTYNTNLKLCKQFNEITSNSSCDIRKEECFINEWGIDNTHGLTKTPMTRLATRQYGYNRLFAIHQPEKQYSIVYLDKFNGDRSPRLLETWKVNAKELDVLINTEPKPLSYKIWLKGKHKIKVNTLAKEFSKILYNSGFMISDEWSPIWNPIFKNGNKDYAVTRECSGRWVYGGYYDCNKVIKIIVNRVDTQGAVKPVCEFVGRK